MNNKSSNATEGREGIEGRGGGGERQMKRGIANEIKDYGGNGRRKGGKGRNNILKKKKEERKEER